MSALLHVDRLYVRRGAQAVLSDVSLKVLPGQRHGLAGPNGSGKSTLLSAIAGELRPTAGRILLDGVDITARPPHLIARLGVARTWQHPALCEHLTAADNVALAARTRTRRSQAHAVLHALGLDGLASRPAGALSYGQQRRLELACALARGARLLLLDEPGAALTRADIEQLAATLRDLGDDIAILFADHDRQLLDTADQVTVLRHGAVTHTAVQARPRRAQVAVVTAPAAQAPALLVHLAATEAGPLPGAVVLQATAGAVTVVTGPNGSGKSTLLNIIAGVVAAPGPAQITLAGRPVHRLGAAQRARLGLRLLPQQRRLFTTLTVVENLLSVHGSGLADVEELAERLPPLRQLLPRPAAALSGGQQQLVAYARACLGRPSVLLLDEPLEGLDSETAALVLEHLAVLLAENTAAVLAEHRLAPQNHADGTSAVDLTPPI